MSHLAAEIDLMSVLDALADIARHIQDDQHEYATTAWELIETARVNLMNAETNIKLAQGLHHQICKDIP